MWRFVKIPKAVALLAFLLPWLTVSCSGTKIAEASGWELVLGKMHPVIAGATEKAGAGSGHLNYFLIAAVIVIVAGLVLSFMARRPGAVGVIVTSVAAIVLIFAGTSQYSSQRIADEISKQSGGAAGAGRNNPFAMGGSSPGVTGGPSDRDMGAAAASMIQMTWQIGYWLALAALIASAVMGFLSMRNSQPQPVESSPLE